MKKELKTRLITLASTIGSIIILFGVLVLTLTSCESVKDIDTKDENIIKTFEEKLNVELVEDVSILNMGSIEKQGYETLPNYYAKIMMPESQVDEFKRNNYSSETYEFDKELYEIYIKEGEKFDWWDFKFEDVDSFMYTVNHKPKSIICKPQNGKVTVYICRY